MPSFSGGPASAAIFTPAATVWQAHPTAYISLADYNAAPTAIDTTSLIPGGTTAANQAALADAILEASAWADTICDQTLAATLDTDTADGILVRRDGRVWVVNTYWPLLELDSFTAGPRPSTAAAVSNTADISMRGRKVLCVPVAGLAGSVNGDTFSAPGPLAPGDRAYCQWSYWNGWPHTTLADPATAGATSITVNTTLPAATAGRSLVISDGADTETVTVASTFTGGTTLPLTAGLAYAHTPPAAPDSITVSALPQNARDAVVHLTTALIKTRGAEAYLMGAVGHAPDRTAKIEGGGVEDLDVATRLLDWYRRVA